MAGNLEKSKLPLNEVLKPTGFRAPESVKDMTFAQAIKSDNPKLEDNKAVTIDVSKYTDPVVVVPSSGKDGLEQVTITLTGITPA